MSDSSDGEQNGLIPQSDALAEALPDSLSELFSRDPFGYSDKDLDRIIDVLRVQRAKWVEAESSVVKPRAPKATKVANLVAKVNADDMGL